MFHSARIKLTGWYLFIIMLISLLFSIIIYSGVSRELDHRFRMIESRFEGQVLGLPAPRRLQKIPLNILEI